MASDKDESEELYKDSSTKLTRSYIILVTFILVFFVSAFLPYFDLQHQKVASLGDSIIRNLTELDRLTLEQEKISKSIQNYLNAPTLAAIEDYKKLDDYFRRLELIESQSVTSSNNLSLDQLENVVPTFLACNVNFHRDINKWLSCNVENVADGVNKRIVLRYKLIAEQISPLQMKANENLKSFNLTSSPLVLDENNKITSKLPRDIDANSWKQTIINSSGRMNSWVRSINSTLDYVSYTSADTLAWTFLENPSLRLTYTYDDPKNFKNVLYSLNQSKNQIEKQIKGLSEKFEEVEFPIVGKVPLGFTTAVIIYPAAIGVGTFICSYYLGQMISKRSRLHRKLAQEFDNELYPLWIEPLWIEPGRRSGRSYKLIRLLLFISIPLTILLITTYLVFSIPLSEESFFDIPQMTILTTSCGIGFILILAGGFMIKKKLGKYLMPPEPPKKGAPFP